jgi:hypothetical protein
VAKTAKGSHMLMAKVSLKERRELGREIKKTREEGLYIKKYV